MSQTRILVTGATGYVGGTVLATLLLTQYDVIRKTNISALVRGKDQAKVLQAKGVQTILFQGFDDHAAVRQAASEHDVVIHTASGFDTECARFLILGLADRKMRLRKEGFYIHTSGTTSLADSPLLDLYPTYPTRVFSDQEPANIVSTLKELNEAATYPQRTTDLAVISLGQETGVRTCIIMLPMLYGRGTGEFNKFTAQITMLIREAMKDGYVSVVGNGEGIKGHVHIEDAGSLFELIVLRLLEGDEVPYGVEGILFVENGYHHWKDVGEGIAKAGVILGQLEDNNVKHLELDEAVGKLDWHNKFWTELAFVSSSRVSSEKPRLFGWKPRNGSADFSQHFVDAWKAVLQHKGRVSGTGRPS